MSDVPLRDLPDRALRDRLRAFLQATYPDRLRGATDRLRGVDSRWWLRTQWEHGWRAPGWPVEHGGLGLSLQQQLLLRDEMERFGVARVLDMGTTMLGPVLFRYGTPEQRAQYLPRILRCEDVWCQGYSEPNSGSDLASLRTAAVRDGEDYVVNGSKIWTTHASDATDIFTLVRTSRDGRKQEGSSVLLIPLATPGITVRPIVNLSGEDEFCQGFFEDVRVPVANRVGEENHGWTVAKALLGFERISIGSPAHARHALATLDGIMGALGSHADPDYAARFIALTADLHDLGVLYREVVDAALAGTARGEQFSMLKLLATELTQRITETMLEVAGEHAGVLGATDFDGYDANSFKLFMLARPGTIYGGSSEVQRNILAKSLLGLPAASQANPVSLKSV